jgi:hypothetical protein
MAARIFFTAVAVMMAVGAFCGAGPTSGGLLDLFGILFLFVAWLIWFAWDLIHEGFVSGPMDFMLVRAALLLRNKLKQRTSD